MKKKQKRKNNFTRRKAKKNAGIQKNECLRFFCPETSSAEHGENGEKCRVFFF
ncbi:MAG: hypothetical protein ACLS5J_03305 [Blautia sp.]|nr:hypothetical protein [Blautia sp.]